MTTSNTPTRIDKLFDRLKALYGSQFLAKWADVDPAELHRIWTAALERYTGDELADALGGVLKSCPFPPSLPDFVKLCDESHARRNPAKAPEQYRLPAPDTSAEVNAKRLEAAAMLQQIGKPGKGLAWARNNLKRHESGEHLLTPEELEQVTDALRYATPETAAA